MTNIYKYKSPIEWNMGYKEVKISKKEFKEIFGKRPGICNKVVVFTRESEDGRKWLCEVYASKIAIILALLLYPFNVLMEGISNIDSLNSTYKDLFNQKKKGTFYRINGKYEKSERWE